MAYAPPPLRNRIRAYYNDGSLLDMKLFLRSIPPAQVQNFFYNYVRTDIRITPFSPELVVQTVADMILTADFSGDDFTKAFNILSVLVLDEEAQKYIMSNKEPQTLLRSMFVSALVKVNQMIEQKEKTATDICNSNEYKLVNMFLRNETLYGVVFTEGVDKSMVKNALAISKVADSVLGTDPFVFISSYKHCKNLFERGEKEFRELCSKLARDLKPINAPASALAKGMDALRRSFPRELSTGREPHATKPKNGKEQEVSEEHGEKP
jgi:hypothetical protein